MRSMQYRHSNRCDPGNEIDAIQAPKSMQSWNGNRGTEIDVIQGRKSMRSWNSNRCNPGTKYQCDPGDGYHCNPGMNIDVRQSMRS